MFLRAKGGAFDAVLTMYHDQGQIAMKLMGFDRGVTLLGGFPFPICTPAHGTAYDIAGKGIANRPAPAAQRSCSRPRWRRVASADPGRRAFWEKLETSAIESSCQSDECLHVGAGT